MVTLKHLAEQLNVSISTVSKALNNSEEISKDTIVRVKELAAHLNYQPNRMALNLKSNRTKTLGVIIPNILNHFFAKSLFAIETEATKQGYNIITCITNELRSKEENSLQLLSNGSVDGFIISIAEETQIENNTEHIELLLEQNIPIVLFDRVADHIACDKVVIDDIGASYEATNHLLKEGRQHIVLLSNIEDLSVGKLRTQGYLKALEEASNYKEAPVVIHVGRDEELESTIDTLFANNKNVDGILSIDNTSGVIALHKALKLGYNVPEKLSIIGFSDDNVLAFTEPKLSTISQHTLEIGTTSVQLLINRLNKNNTTDHQTKTIKTNLILRGSTI